MSRRWAIQVVYPNGEIAYLRHGTRIGFGEVTTFGTRKLADVNREMVAMGLDAGCTVNVVQYRKEPQRGVHATDQ